MQWHAYTAGRQKRIVPMVHVPPSSYPSNPASFARVDPFKFFFQEIPT